MDTPPATTQAPAGPLLSIVIPVRNEEANIAPLADEIRGKLAGIDHETVFIDDGSDDGTRRIIMAQAEAHASIVWRGHRRSCGQSAAVVTGIRAARGRWIATLDGDGQNDPGDIDGLLKIAMDRRGDAPLLIAGRRVGRQDRYVKRVSSTFANRIRGSILKDATPDSGCGLKVFRRDDFLLLPVFDHMHRFLPALFIRAGGEVMSVPISHRPRRSGASKYGTLDRLAVGIVDLFGVWWLQRRNRRPVVEGPP